MAAMLPPCTPNRSGRRVPDLTVGEDAAVAGGADVGAGGGVDTAMGDAHHSGGADGGGERQQRP
jgi:hypothetical protein